MSVFTLDGEGLDWRVKFTIDKDTIDANLTDKDVYVRLSDLGSDFWDNVKSDGGDVRCALSDGTTRVPAGLKNFTDGGSSGTGQLYLKLSSMSSSVDPEFYVYWGNAALSQPAADSTNGFENVFAATCILASPCEEDPSGSAPQMLDLTSNDNHGTTSGTMTSGDLVPATVGNGVDYDNVNDYSAYPLSGDWDVDSGAVEILFKTAYANTATGRAVWEVWTSDINRMLGYFEPSDDTFRFINNAGLETNSAISAPQTFSAGTVYHIAYHWNFADTGQDLRMWINGVEVAHPGAALLTWTTGDMNVALTTVGGSPFFHGDNNTDDVRAHNAHRDPAEYVFNYHNLTNPGGTYSIGTYEGPVAASTGNAIGFAANF